MKTSAKILTAMGLSLALASPLISGQQALDKAGRSAFSSYLDQEAKQLARQPESLDNTGMAVGLGALGLSLFMALLFFISGRAQDMELEGHSAKKMRGHGAH